jgi:hypothetical protein
MKKIALTVLGAMVVSALPSFASPILADGAYHEFLFGPGPAAVGACGLGCTPTINPVADTTASPPWTFSGAANILVLDLFAVGDTFEAFDNGLSLGTTTNVANTGADFCGNNIGCALSNSAYSRGTFSVGAGTHSLTINHIRDVPVAPGGAAVFSVTATTASTPEPATSALFGASLIGLSFLRRRRRHA